jgi:hypothetical protein
MRLTIIVGYVNDFLGRGAPDIALLGVRVTSPASATRLSDFTQGLQGLRRKIGTEKGYA